MNGITLWSIAGENFAAELIEDAGRHHELRGWFSCDDLEINKHGIHESINLGKYIPDVCGIGRVIAEQDDGERTRVEFASAGPIARTTPPPGETPLDRLRSLAGTDATRKLIECMFGKDRVSAILLGDSPIQRGEAKRIGERFRVNELALI